MPKVRNRDNSINIPRALRRRRSKTERQFAKLFSKEGISVNTTQNDAAVSILNTLGISVATESMGVDYTLLDGACLDIKKLESFEKTEDNNPNRLQTSKFEKLKSKKIKSSEVFSEVDSNPLFERDEKFSNERASKKKPKPNVVAITGKLINNNLLDLSEQ